MNLQKKIENGILNAVTTLRLFLSTLFNLGNDSLTGLKNASWYAARQRSKFITSNFEIFIYLDVNGLKRENDSKGHAAGDRLLQNFGANLKRFSKQYNFTATRLHGDEFLMFALAPLKNWEKGLVALKEGESCSWGIGTSEDLAEKQMRKAKDLFYALHPSLERRQADRRQLHNKKLLRLNRMNNSFYEKQLQMSQQMLERVS